MFINPTSGPFGDTHALLSLLRPPSYGPPTTLGTPTGNPMGLRNLARLQGINLPEGGSPIGMRAITEARSQTQNQTAQPAPAPQTRVGATAPTFTAGQLNQAQPPKTRTTPPKTQTTTTQAPTSGGGSLFYAADGTLKRGKLDDPFKQSFPEAAKRFETFEEFFRAIGFDDQGENAFKGVPMGVLGGLF